MEFNINTSKRIEELKTACHAIHAQVGVLAGRAVTVLSSSLSATSVLGSVDGTYKSAKVVTSTANFAKQMFKVSLVENYAKALSPVASLHNIIRPFDRLKDALENGSFFKWATVVGEGLDIPRHLQKLSIVTIVLPVPVRALGAAAATLSLGKLVVDNYNKKLKEGDNIAKWERIAAIATYAGKAFLAIAGFLIGANYVGGVAVMLKVMSCVMIVADYAGFAQMILKNYPKQVKEEKASLAKVENLFPKAA